MTGCERCGQLTTLLRLVIIDGWPRTASYPPPTTHPAKSQLISSIARPANCSRPKEKRKLAESWDSARSPNTKSEQKEKRNEKNNLHQSGPPPRRLPANATIPVVSTMRLKIKEKQCKTALGNSAMRYDYCLNPYTGCLHSCQYCYATFMRRFTGHLRDPWGTFADPKTNFAAVLAKELPRRPGGSVWISSVCDPYQQLEAKYKLTRSAIQLLSQYPDFKLSILTKSVMVLRDLDILEPIRDRVEVGFSASTFEERAQRIFEPHAAPIARRISAVKQLNDAGIPIWFFVAPMLPFVTEIQLEDGLNRLRDAGVKHLESDRYNARGGIITKTLAAYMKWDPNCDTKQIRNLLWHGDRYYHNLEAKISDLWQRITPTGTYEKDQDYANLPRNRKITEEIPVADRQQTLT
jgi:DNA repair photolyase